ncbi:flagellar basal body-associated FliL family protein [Loktanella sp. M215]|uniref:flagellar basal body-associated FliL family protein n=1 Tax=Loktanella sp. M215 TaxID=2675431 RepID=UPI001F01C618|nr:flagellar basal body-associated FliL family protein [Loktanella sp. M215]MCF7698832.1 flagellar basal body protein FliL [Loktanella sp. M215]
MTAVADEEVLPKKSKMPLFLGLVLALAGGGAGFFAITSGMIGGSGDHGDAAESEHAGAASDHAADATAVPVAFVPLEPMVISLQGPQKYLRFTAQVEVAPAAQAEVTAVVPRIVDVLNGYLRAVDAVELADPAALMRLRAQMLRRVQVVAGADNVRDLLIMEFVLN